jgi:hypothetical protein
VRKKVEDQQLVRLKLCFLDLKTTRQPKCLAQGYAAAALGFSVKLVAVETAPKQKSPPFLILAPAHHDVQQFQCNTQNHR